MAVRTKDWKGDIKYLGKSKAIVVDNNDPLHKGRVKVDSPVFGLTGWIAYLVPDDGFYGPPDIGSIVYVEADGGDSDYIIATSTVNDGEDDNPDTPESFRRDVPTNRGWKTPGGNLLELDDGVAVLQTDGSIVTTAELRGVRLSTAGGHSFKLLEEGSEGSQLNRAEILTTGGQVLQMVDDTDPAKQQIVVKDADDRTIEIIKETDRIRIRNKSGTIFIDVDFANDIIEIDANNVKLGTNAAEAIVRGDTFRTLFNSHRHVSSAPGSPTGFPIQQMDPASANTHLSDKHKVE